MKSDEATIKNKNTNNAVTVTYSAYPNNNVNVAYVQIYKNKTLTGTVVASASFHKTQPHEATFRLPAGATYYAKISSYDGGSFTGVFVATY